MREDSEALNLDQFVDILRRRIPLIALCAIVVAGAAFGFSKHKAKTYTATASLSFSNNPLSQQISGLPVSTSGNVLAQEASNLELVKLGDMAARTASLLGHGLTAREVSGDLSIAGEGESGVVAVSASTYSPELAAKIANTYTSAFVQEQLNANRQDLRSALALVREQLAELSPQQRIGVDGVSLQNRAQSLGLLEKLQYGNVKVAQKALAPVSPSSPNTKKATITGGIIGLLIGFGIAFLLERADRRIKRPEELESIYHRPMLGTVPKTSVIAHASRRKGGQGTTLPPDELEAFRLIRAQLRFFNSDRDLRAIIVASTTPGDGNTTVARYLAETEARSGSRVLLLEADLRHPKLAQLLDIPSGPGLAGVLGGTVTMREATRSVELHTAYPQAARTAALDLLAAGDAIPPNPGELLESREMDAVLEFARSTYDVVVIDVPPPTSVSDAFPLLDKVDGIVVVARLGHSRRDAAERLHQILARTHTPLLGFIANGHKSRDSVYVTSSVSDLGSSATASTNGGTQSAQIMPSTKV